MVAGRIESPQTTLDEKKRRIRPHVDVTIEYGNTIYTVAEILSIFPKHLRVIIAHFTLAAAEFAETCLPKRTQVGEVLQNFKKGIQKVIEPQPKRSKQPSVIRYSVFDKETNQRTVINETPFYLTFESRDQIFDSSPVDDD